MKLPRFFLRYCSLLIIGVVMCRQLIQLALLARLIVRYPFPHIAQRLLVNRDVDLEKAFAGVAEWYAKDGVSQGGVTETCQAFGDAAGWGARIGIDNFPALSR